VLAIRKKILSKSNYTERPKTKAFCLSDG